MKKVTLLSNTIVFSLLFGLLIVGALGSSNFYIGVKSLYLFRVALVIVFLYTMYILAKRGISFSHVSKVILSFFSIYFIWTIFISIFLTKISLDNYFNFTLLYILIIILIFLMEYDPKLYAKVFYKISNAMLFVSIAIAAWEITTHQHLSSWIYYNTSASEYLGFVPSAFYGNPNQLALTLALVVFYIIGYSDINNKKLNYIFYITILASIGIAFFAQSVLIVMILGLTLLFTFLNPKDIIKLMFFMFMLFLASSILSNTMFNSELFPLEFIIDGFQSGGSASIRYHLYVDALMSIEKNYTLGFGINNSSTYYQLINDAKVEGIINPHNYLLEILINSGLIVTLLYLALNMYLVFIFYKSKQAVLIFLLIGYHIVLISGSSSLFGWYHYIFYIGLIALHYVGLENKINERLSK